MSLKSPNDVDVQGWKSPDRPSDFFRSFMPIAGLSLSGCSGSGLAWPQFGPICLGGLVKGTLAKQTPNNPSNAYRHQYYCLTYRGVFNPSHLSCILHQTA